MRKEGEREMLAFAQKYAPASSAADDSYRAPDGGRRAIALATTRSSR